MPITMQGKQSMEEKLSVPAESLNQLGHGTESSISGNLYLVLK